VWSRLFGIGQAFTTLLGRTLQATASHGGSYRWGYVHVTPSSMRALADAAERCRLRPTVDTVHPLDRVLEAMERQQSRRHTGKVVVSTA
jgi:NADPH:quinone reductase-like Zn-dependent oxidoreductase